MYQGIANYPEIDLDKIIPIGYDRKDAQESYERTIENLRSVKPLFDKLYQISTSVKLPPQINAEVNGELLAFIGIINELELENNFKQSLTEFYNVKSSLLLKINNSFIQQRMEISTNNRFLMICNTVFLFKQEKPETEANDLAKVKQEFEVFLTEAKNGNDVIAKEVKELENRATSALKEIQDKASTTLISKYADVFNDEATRYKNTAISWMIFGGSMCAISIALLALIFGFGWLNASERIVRPDKVYYIYDYSKLISKFLLVSIFLFLISYSFRKHSIYKHLQTINRHRLNALNSYKLLTESIIGDDPATRNSLMLQVAKSIYEHTATGFISTKEGESQASEILEITKIIGSGKS